MKKEIKTTCKKHFEEFSFYCEKCKTKFCNICLEEDTNCVSSLREHALITIKKYTEILANEINKESKLDSIISMQKRIEELFHNFKSHNEILESFLD